jgi:cytochrome c oxidase subunit II
MRLQHFFIIGIVIALFLVGCSKEAPQQVEVQEPSQESQGTYPVGQVPTDANPEDLADDSAPLVEDQNQETTSGDTVKEFDMIVKRFAFEPNVIRVSEGDRVIIHATSPDVAHSFLVPELNINERTPAGETVDIEFIADAKGEFDFRCGVPCGSGHTSMSGKIIVE